VHAVKVYTVNFSLNTKSKQWLTGDSGKFEHTDYSNKFYVPVGVLSFRGFTVVTMDIQKVDIIFLLLNVRTCLWKKLNI